VVATGKRREKKKRVEGEAKSPNGGRERTVALK
jgi:hypothetical protein